MKNLSSIHTLQQAQYGKVRDPNFGAVILTFDYENVSNLMTFGQKFWPFREQGFCRLTFLKGEK